MNAVNACCSETGGLPGVHCPLKAPNALLADFIQFYARSAARRGIAVDVEVMRGVAREFLRTHPLDSFAFAECRRLLGEAEGRSLPPLDRILVEPLRPLLPRFGGTPGTPEATRHPMLSRRVIPGLLSALAAVLGQERMERLRRRAESLAEIHLSPERGEADWAALAHDPECAAIQEDAGLALVRHFGDFDRRLAWLMAIVDAHAPPAPNAAERDWTFGERQALALLLAATRPLRAARDAPGPDTLALHCDAATMVAVDHFFATLDARARAQALAV
ncbi:conserved hypothetical protein [uncultured Alphaproteobacteria bacterium]|uniref:Uncharacterized protein n=1 Tax=uncultured Alphaproteobacteria bacterium TaxID=91750 RepID=A0A212IWH6_9PROT|nr:conserved hypothetical protein [uncultured Alphaproteobacteria bacterium]